MQIILLSKSILYIMIPPVDDEDCEMRMETLFFQVSVEVSVFWH